MKNVNPKKGEFPLQNAFWIFLLSWFLEKIKWFSPKIHSEIGIRPLLWNISNFIYRIHYGQFYHLFVLWNKFPFFFHEIDARRRYTGKVHLLKARIGPSIVKRRRGEFYGLGSSWRCLWMRVLNSWRL